MYLVAETFPDLLADVLADADDETGRSHLDDLTVVGHAVEGGVDRKAAFAVQGFDVKGDFHVGGIHVLVFDDHRVEFHPSGRPLLSVRFLKLPSQRDLVIDGFAQGLQPFGVGGVVEPEVQVAAATVLLAQVLHHPSIMSFLVQFGVVFHAVLHGAADDGVGVDEAVGFGHDAPVETAGCVVGGGTVVLDGLRHCLQLAFREPLL